MRNFFNDADGVSITDFVATVYLVVYIVLTVLLVCPIEINHVAIKVYDTFAYGMYIILGGFFGRETVSAFISKKYGDKEISTKIEAKSDESLEINQEINTEESRF